MVSPSCCLVLIVSGNVPHEAVMSPDATCLITSYVGRYNRLCRRMCGGALPRRTLTFRLGACPWFGLSPTGLVERPYQGHSPSFYNFLRRGVASPHIRRRSRIVQHNLRGRSPLDLPGVVRHWTSWHSSPLPESRSKLTQFQPLNWSGPLLFSCVLKCRS